MNVIYFTDCDSRWFKYRDEMLKQAFINITNTRVCECDREIDRDKLRQLVASLLLEE